VLAAALASGLAPFRKKGYTLRHHFMLTTLLAVLGLPTTLLKPAIDDHAIALAEILPAMFRLLAEHHDVNEADFFLEFIRLLEAPTCRQTKAGDRRPARRISQLGVAGQISDQNDFIESRQGWLLAVLALVHLSVEQAPPPISQ